MKIGTQNEISDSDIEEGCNELTSGSPSPSVLPLAQKTQEEQIWKTRKRQLSVLSLCVICTLMKMGILCQLQDGVTRGAIDEASRSLIAIDNAQFPPVLALNVLLKANLFYRYKKKRMFGVFANNEIQCYQ